MVTKWRNRLTAFVAGLFLVAGWFLFIMSFSTIDFYKKGKLEYDDIHQRVENIYAIDYLNSFDPKTITPEAISGEYVDRYRYQYGDLQGQVQDVNRQYQDPIQEAKAEKEVDEANRLTAERDEKVLAIVTNFTDGDAVKQKIAEEETKKIMKEKAGLLEEFEANKEYFEANYYYYFSDNNGKTFKNVSWLSSKMDSAERKKKLETEGVGELTVIDQVPVTWDISSTTSVLREVAQVELSGFVIPIKGSQAAENYQADITYYKQAQRNLTIGIVLLIIGSLLVILYFRQGIANQKVANFIQKVPLDLRLLLLLSSGIFAGYWMRVSMKDYFAFSDELIVAICSGLFIFFILLLVLLKDLWLSLRRKEGYPTLRIQNEGAVYRKIGRKLSQSSSYFKAGATLTLLAISLGLAVLDGAARNLTGVLVLFTVVGFIALLLAFYFVRREDQLSELLQQPALILRENEEHYEDSSDFASVHANLAELNKIVSATKANKLRNEELKTELLTNVSHDLRTPLTSIITYGDLLTQARLKEPERQEYTSIINQKAMRMKHLIDDLFEVTKMNNGEIILNKKMINLGQLIQQSIAEYGDEFTKKDLKLLYSKPSSAILMMIDGDRMWRVFDNLIGNVIKYSMPNTRVYLKLSESDEEVIIQLKNVSQYELHEDATNLVERFKRGDDARHTEGSGLGLAIANSIVDLHEGRLEIDIDGDMFKILIVLPKNQ